MKRTTCCGSIFVIRIVKRRGLLSKKVLLQHDNARPHASQAIIETTNKLDFEVLRHPAYSPYLALFHNHLFAPLKDALRGLNFFSDCLFFCMNQKLRRLSNHTNTEHFFGFFLQVFLQAGSLHSFDEAVQKAVHEWKCDQPKTFFSYGIHKLVNR